MPAGAIKYFQVILQSCKDKGVLVSTVKAFFASSVKFIVNILQNSLFLCILFTCQWYMLFTYLRWLLLRGRKALISNMKRNSTEKGEKSFYPAKGKNFYWTSNKIFSREHFKDICQNKGYLNFFFWFDIDNSWYFCLLFQ